MATSPRFLGVIPARAGSKGVPNKTVHPVAGRPLIGWTIDTALQSGALDRVVVTTEDPGIASTARELGAEVPFLRPSELAADNVPNMEAVLHAVGWLREHEKYQSDYTVLLQPTSPLCAPDDITAACRMAQERDADGVVSVSVVHQHPGWMRTVDKDGKVSPYLPEHRELPRRQTLPILYVTNGAIFVVKTDVFVQQRTYEPDSTFAYVMPQERALEVDSQWDLHVAEIVLNDRLRISKV